MTLPKPAIEKAWGESATLITDPGNTKIEAGWIKEKPKAGHMNYMLNRIDSLLQHINENGICIWDTDTVYVEGSVVKGSDDKIYISKTASNQGNNPTTDGTNWIVYGVGLPDWSAVTIYGIGDLVKGSDDKIYISTTASNQGNDPTTDDGTNWEEYGVGGTLITSKMPCSGSGTIGQTFHIGYDITTFGNAIALSGSSTAGTIDSTITNVTDISDPAGTGGWTDLVDITNTEDYTEFRASATSSYWVIRANSSANGDTHYRIQIVVDDVIAGDVEVTASVGTSGQVGIRHVDRAIGSGNEHTSIFFKDTLKIRVARQTVTTTSSDQIDLYAFNIMGYTK